MAGQCQEIALLLHSGGVSGVVLNPKLDLPTRAQMIVAEKEQSRGILGVVDGVSPTGVEGKAGITKLKEFLRKIGCK